MRCDALLFDLDGVLVDSTAVVERQWEIWARAHGFDAKAILAVAHGRRIIETLRAVAPELATEEEAERLARAEAEDVEGLRVIAGAADLLASLPPETWTIVTSGTRAVATARLRHAGLPVPEKLVTADDVPIGKPSPVPYLRAARSLNVEPERCVVIEDAPPGIASANAAGMRSVAVAGTYSREALSGATAIVNRLADLRVERGPGVPYRLEVRLQDAGRRQG